MQTYEEVVEKFLFESLPAAVVPRGETKLEAVAAEVIGTKQRRFGPVPSPEVQVAVREYVRDRDELTFFLPWGSSKQTPGDPVDIMEVMALKQLLCLKDGLARYGVKADFHFRVEDLTDRFLFGPTRLADITAYRNDFKKLVAVVLGGTARAESWFASYPEFELLAESLVPKFYAYLTGRADHRTIADLGWAGTIPQEQRDYYFAQYRVFYPGQDFNMELARYFAATLARVKLGATGAPANPHLLIAFTHPVPGNPVAKTRLHYRSIPERFTNVHRSPWLAKGYLEIDEANRCVPKALPVGTPRDRIEESAIIVGGVTVRADYRLV